MIMSKDEVITEIRDLKPGAKGVLNSCKAPWSMGFTQHKNCHQCYFPVGCGVGNLFKNQWPFERMKYSHPEALHFLKAHQQFMPCNACFGYT